MYWPPAMEAWKPVEVSTAPVSPPPSDPVIVHAPEVKITSAVIVHPFRQPEAVVQRGRHRVDLHRVADAERSHRAEHREGQPELRLLTLTGARLSEVLNLKWDEIGELSEDGASARLEDSKTGPRTVWLGPEAARLLAALPRPEGAGRVFPDDLTPARLYTFWCAIREEAELPGLRIHDARHTWASQGVMNGVGLTTVGRLLGHRKRRTTAIYAHLDDAALQGDLGRAGLAFAASAPGRWRWI